MQHTLYCHLQTLRQPDPPLLPDRQKQHGTHSLKPAKLHPPLLPETFSNMLTFTTQNLPALLQLLRLQVRHSLPATDNVRIILLPLEQT